MSFTLASAALAFLVWLPLAKADRVCQTDGFGNRSCYDGNSDYTVRAIIASVLLGLSVIFLTIGLCIRARRRRTNRQAASAAFANMPAMSYGQGWQGQQGGQSAGATIPATYNPNAPPQGGQFNGYWQNANPPQYPAPTYAPQGALPYGEKETV